MALPLKERLITLLMPSALYYGRRIADEAAWGEHELDVLGEIVQPGGTAIDVGANQGVFAFAFSRIADYDGVRAQPRLCRLRAPHAGDASPRASGCAPREKRTKIRRPGLGGGTVLHLGGYLQQATAQHSKAMRFEVEVRTLDSYAFRDVRIIKVDVEGSEMEVLEGGRETILRDRPPLIVELLTGAHADPVAVTETFCAAYGYAAWLVTKDRARVEALPVMRSLGSNTTWDPHPQSQRAVPAAVLGRGRRLWLCLAKR
jgi:hypothetical protein